VKRQYIPIFWASRFVLTAISVILYYILSFEPPKIECGDTIYKDQVIVLMYHHLDEQHLTKATITPQRFEEQLSHLKKCKFHFITMNDFLQYKN
jgi:hypothetical protein